MTTRTPKYGDEAETPTRAQIGALLDEYHRIVHLLGYRDAAEPGQFHSSTVDEMEAVRAKLNAAIDAARGASAARKESPVAPDTQLASRADGGLASPASPAPLPCSPAARATTPEEER